MCAGNIHLPNTYFKLSAPLLGFSDWKLLIIVSPQSQHRTAPSDVDRVMCSLGTPGDTRVLLWHELFCLLAWSCARPRRHSSRLHLASLSCITTRTVCVLSSQSSSRLHNCVGVGGGSFGVRACTPMRGTGAATLRVPPSLCRALLPRASGRRLHNVHLDRARLVR